MCSNIKEYVTIIITIIIIVTLCDVSGVSRDNRYLFLTSHVLVDVQVRSQS